MPARDLSAVIPCDAYTAHHRMQAHAATAPSRSRHRLRLDSRTWMVRHGDLPDLDVMYRGMRIITYSEDGTIFVRPLALPGAIARIACVLPYGWSVQRVSRTRGRRPLWNFRFLGHAVADSRVRYTFLPSGDVLVDGVCSSLTSLLRAAYTLQGREAPSVRIVPVSWLSGPVRYSRPSDPRSSSREPAWDTVERIFASHTRGGAHAE